MILRLKPTRRAMTLIEVLVAVSIILVIMAGIVTVFIELLRSHDQARARIDATSNARAAIEVLSAEIRRAENTTASLATQVVFRGETTSGTVGGDRIDKDGDGVLDEETLDALDTDADWVIADDKHARFVTSGTQYAERPLYVNIPDLDDGHIDVDLANTSATVEFDTFDVPGEPLERRVRFYIGSDADGTPNTLMREITGVDTLTSTVVVTSGPICHNVVSFGLLFWDFTKAGVPNENPWLTEWPPADPASASPSTVYITISVYSGTPIPLNELPANREIETVTLTTAVNVEAVLSDSNFILLKQPVLPAP